MKVFIVTLMISLGVVLNVIADVFLKKSGITDWKFFSLGIISYALIAFPVVVAFKYSEFGRVFLVWEAMAVILGLAVASMYYKEPFTTYRLIAMILALSALYFSYK